MNKNKAPLFNKMQEYVAKGQLGFHTPGHQGGKGLDPSLYQRGPELWPLDLTEVSDLDNLKKPSGCIKEAQARAAELFGAQASFFLVNGSTAGLHAGLLALTAPDDKILVPCHTHISVFNGLVLSGGQPLLAPVQILDKWGIPLGTAPNQLEELLQRHKDLKALLLVHPTYQGIALAAKELRQLSEKYSVPLLADEAHGAHLFFQNKIPLSLQKAGADIVVQSTHKTLGALTQASMLHINNSDYLSSVEQALGILHTTSPSYLLMASLDCVQAQMTERGQEIMDQTWQLAYEWRRKIHAIKGFEVLEITPSPWYQDPTKLIISAASLGLTGWDLASILEKKYGIVVELSDYYYVLLLVTLGHTQEHGDRLMRALQDIARFERKSISLRPWQNELRAYQEGEPLLMTPRQVYFSKKRMVDLREAEGEILACPLTVYPPGIPLLWPGQIVTKVCLEYLEWLLAHQLPISGIDKERQQLKVVADREEGLA